LSRYTLLDYGVGNEAEAAEVECFCDFEPRDHPRSDAFARLRDRGRRNVDAGDIGAATGCQQSVLAGAAASVEKASGQAALVSEPTKAGCGLPVSHGAGVPAV
jgi:hypothetical protein